MLSSIHLVLTMSSDSSAPPGLRLPGLLHCPGGFRPKSATRLAPTPVEYLRRNAGLNHELFILSSGHCDFMSRLLNLNKLTEPLYKLIRCGVSLLEQGDFFSGKDFNHEFTPMHTNCFL